MWDLKTHAEWNNTYPEFFARVNIWMPSKRVNELASHDNVPYRTWIEQGYINEAFGAVIETYDIAEETKQALYDGWFEGLAYDPYRMNQMKKDLQNMGLEVFVGNRWAEGLRLFPHAQGHQVASPAKEDEGGIQLWMTDSIRQLVELLLKNNIWVEFNPVLRWAVAGASLEVNKRGNKAFDRITSTSRIDALIALTMSAGFLVALRRLAGEYVVSKTLDASAAIDQIYNENKNEQTHA